MAVSIGSLLINLRASTAGFSRDAEKAIQMSRRIGNKMALAVGAGAMAAGGGLALVLEQANERIDKLAKASDRLGVPIEKLRTLQHVAELSGSSFDSMNGALESAQQQIVLAAAGSKKAQWAFDGLGLSVDELMKLSPDQQFAQIANALNQVQNQSLKATYASKIFGGASREMLSVIQGGSAALDDANKKLISLGVSLNRVDAAKVEIAGDAMSELKLVSEGVTNQLAIAMAPVLKGIADLLMKAASDTEGFRNVLETAVTWGVKGFGWLANAWRGWEFIVKSGQVVFSALFAAIGTAAGVTMNLVTSMAIKLKEILVGVARTIENVLDSVQSSKVLSVMFPQLRLVAEGMDLVTGSGERLSTTLAKSLGGMTSEIGSWASSAVEFQNATVDGLAQTVAEWDALLSKPLPSDNFDKWLAEVRAKTQTAATEIANSVKPVYDAINVPPLSDETVKETRDRLVVLRDSLADEVYNPWLAAYESIQNQIGQLVRGTLSWRDALTEVAATFVTTVIQSLVQMAAQWVATQLAMALGFQAAQAAAGAAAAGTAAAQAAAVQAAWIPAAIAASIATMGAASWVGLGSFISATALGTTAAVGIGAVGNLAATALTGATMSGARAQGGHVNAGSLYRVNENGIEMFRPDVSGEVVPMGDYEQDLNQGAAPMSVSISQVFTGGVTEADLARAAARTKKETLGAVIDGVRRAGSFRKGIRR